MTMAVLFIAQATNTELTLMQPLTLLAVTMVMSKGASGVTNAGFVTLAATLAVMPRVPLSGMVLILGIDAWRVLDGLRGQRGAGQFDQAEKIVTDNRVLFHRMANTLNYLDIKTVVVSCGTCYDQLTGYAFDPIFPGSRMIDIHEFLLEKDIRLDGVSGVRYMYHDPFHTPIKTMDPTTLVNRLMGGAERIEKNTRCCGEAGTLAVTRPDISTQVRFRKEEEIKKGAARVRADGFRAVFQ